MMFSKSKYILLFEISNCSCSSQSRMSLFVNASLTCALVWEHF